MREILFSAPDITDNEIAAVEKVIRSGWLAHGKYSNKLEALFCEFTGAPYATTVSNCTAGLHLSCLAAGFGPGDEVIVPAQTHTATAHAVEYTGAKAVFADVDPLTANMTVTEMKKRCTAATKGVIPVHMAGYPCDMPAITSLCKEKRLVLIEDCAHAIGTLCNGLHAGNYGLSGSFSFYPTKQITTGEGGVVISNDENIIGNMKSLKAFGIDISPEMRFRPGVYDVQGLGYNYRMTDFQAALGVGQMERYRVNLGVRKLNGKRYTERLTSVDGVRCPEYSEENSYFLFQVVFDEYINRDRILRKLRDKGVGVSIHYATPVPLMTYYRRKYGCTEEEFPNAVRYGHQSLSLPVHGKITESDIDYICSTIQDNIQEKLHGG
jgi:dTDP-4-amino-4,6-dideoxygalactose transaminase